MQYDPVAFREIQRRQRAARQVRRVERPLRSVYLTSTLTTISDGVGEPYAKLAAAIILLAVRDYRRAKRGRVSVESAEFAYSRGYKTVVEECIAYFSSHEFENHCALVDIEPDAVRRHIGLTC